MARRGPGGSPGVVPQIPPTTSGETTIDCYGSGEGMCICTFCWDSGVDSHCHSYRC